MELHWPEHLPVGAMRFARPTAKLDECVRFYRDALGLAVLAEFAGHDGYDGVILGLPGSAVHMELTYRADGPAVPEPSPENQIVFYLPDAAAVAAAAGWLRSAGYSTLEPENPYWSARGTLAFADPDGWQVLLAPWVFSAVEATA